MTDDEQSTTDGYASLGPARDVTREGVPFEGYVAARGDRLLRTAYLLTHDHQLAEDLLQTALARAWGSWGRVEDHDAYVRKILVNTYSSWWRRRWNGEHPTETLPEQARGADDAEAHAGRADLWTAIAQLPRRQRAVVVLRFYEDLSEAETADALGCARGTVKSQTSKALAKLRIDPGLLDSYAPATSRTVRPDQNGISS